MQKDYFISAFNTVSLDPDAANKAIGIKDIISTELITASGAVSYSGYLDIGLIDTTKDLIVNFVGAVIFCMLGYVYVKHRGKGRIASSFIPVIEGDGNKTESDASKTPKDEASL